MLMPLMALALAASSPVELPDPIGVPTEPTFNLSAMVVIRCEEGQGTGFIIGDGIVATALHVASMHSCKDAKTDRPMMMYKADKEHDFALMTHRALFKMPPMHYDCAAYTPGRTFTAYGMSSFNQEGLIARAVSLKFNGIYQDVLLGSDMFYGMAVLSGYNVHGMSGGPIVDQETGMVIGIVNAGADGPDGLPVGISMSFQLKDTILCK